ncbi:MAG: hypothetical protein ACRBBW_11300 [Cellvibrionaceae bacterium]
MNRWVLAHLFIAFVALAGCQSSKTIEPNHSRTQACEEPRPQMCTYQYDPVCARHADGHYSTKSNACSACSDSSVIETYAGECLGSSR